MGYFSNLTEFELWAQDNCRKCIHDQDPDEGCPIVGAHLAHSEGEDGVAQKILEWFIPLSDDESYNDKCKMFVPKD